MKKKIILLILTFFIFGCNNNIQKTTLNIFFANNNWTNFNKLTLNRAKLNHFIDADIDFFHRESFFSFMKNSKYVNKYDDFYLIEIENLDGERTQSKKILVINNNDKIVFLAFRKGINWGEVSISDAERKKYTYNNLTNTINATDNEYIIITRIVKNQF